MACRRRCDSNEYGNATFIHHWSKWQWYYPTPKGKYYEVNPGQSNRLIHEDWLIGGHRIRIWANTADGRWSWSTYRDRDLYLAPKEGYHAPYSTFTYTVR